jgi:DUF4097 and DUF4098 domain-containing protein YvlB
MNQRNMVALGLCAVLLTVMVSAGEKTQSFSAKKGGQLELRADAGSVTVRGWDKDEVYVRVQSLNEEQLKSVTMSEGGGKVLVEFRWAQNRNVEDLQFDISVPSSFNIDVRTAGGGLVVQSPLSGTLKGTTAGGSIKLGNLGGTIQMETAGGEISSGDISGDVTVRTAGGNIDLKSASGVAIISTAGGGITVGGVGKSLQASTAGGNIDIGRVGSDLSASTAGGSIKVKSAHGNISLNTAGGSIELTSGSGKVSASTSAGNVTLSDIEGSVNAHTTAGDINVFLNPSAGDQSMLATSAGSIVLTVPTNAKATISARSRGPFSGMGDTDNSQIHSEYPLTHSAGGHGEGEGEVILNGGGHRITLETMIGTIEIKKPH